ncbi:hypothetical protein L873DRAFT_63510 [Choiromyces venosus 120613-1]|uniref:Uncharacterized protein n=1 Tax=Choiromyces venosus 120613-1 TaxID=1336337 RepID=A0A3N4J9Z6_9PEZI|nr:hypothetical protein L873DRAFT_63510 [Choiromyces venosus 120613-1]
MALAPVAIELLFTNSNNRQYSLKDLFLYLIAQPIPRWAIGIYAKVSLHIAQNALPVVEIGSTVECCTLSIKAASITGEILSVPMSVFPKCLHAQGRIGEINLVDWVIGLSDNDILKLDPDPDADYSWQLTIQASLFTSFLEPSNIDDEPVGMLSVIWNQHALPGWACLSPKKARDILDNLLVGDIGKAVTVAVGGRRFGLPYSHAIMPLASINRIFAAHIAFANSTVTLYTWEAEIPEVVSQMMNIVSKLKQHDSFEGWSVMVKGTNELLLHETDIASRNETWLDYLHFAHTVVTGSRFFNEKQDGRERPTDDEIIAACFFEAYKLGAGKDQVFQASCLQFSC